MKHIFFLLLVFLTACSSGLQDKTVIKKKGSGGGGGELKVFGKLVPDFYKQFYYHKQPDKECGTLHIYLQMLEKIQSAQDGLFLDVDLFLLKKRNVGEFNLRVNFYKKTGEQFVKVNSDSVSDDWKFDDVNLVMMKAGKLYPQSDKEEFVTFRAHKDLKVNELYGKNINLYYRKSCFGWNSATF